MRFLDTIFDGSIPRRDRTMIVYDRVEDFYQFGRFYELGLVFDELCKDKYLEKSVQQESVSVTLSILTATNLIYTIPNRRAFYEKFEARLKKEIGEKDTKRNLVGLGP